MTALRQAAKAVFAACDVFFEPPRGPRILIYHQVGAGLGRQMEVEVDDFEWQLDWLLEHRRVVSLEDALARSKDADAQELVVLTFDDGYSDLFDIAYPLMKERDLPFTVYLSTAAIGCGPDEAGASLLRWAQVENMMAAGLVTIGSHTHGHLDLRTLSEDRIEKELATADLLIESRLGVEPHHFAYPYGYWAAAADSLVRQRYDSATLGGYWRASGYDDHHMLNRVPIQLSDGRRWFARRLLTGFIAEERVRRRLRGYDGP